MVANDPLHCVVNGCGEVVENWEEYKTVYRNKKHRQIKKFKPFKRQAGMSRLFLLQKLSVLCLWHGQPRATELRPSSTFLIGQFASRMVWHRLSGVFN
ncbi:MAG: hypothetical protein CM15mP39_02540 [Synechococcus sp.]|nr:MAG: hypothetical protein CM15mP39_02540 [Synechococcus sp.]